MKTKLLKYLLASGMVLGCSSLANASYVYNYIGNYYSGNSYGPGVGAIPTQTQTGTAGNITVSETGVWANFNNSGSNVVANGSNAYGGTAPASNYLAVTDDALYNGDGIGVCNPNQQNANVDVSHTSCGSPDHQLTNMFGLDFVLFGFNTPVSLSSVQVQSFGNPTNSSGTGPEYIDMSYAILTATQESQLLAGTLLYSSVTDWVTQTSTDTNGAAYTYSLTGTAQYVLIGTAVTADYGNSADVPDAFKIQDLTVNPVSAVPEPASFFLIGTGLLAGAAFGRRRMKVKK